MRIVTQECGPSQSPRELEWGCGEAQPVQVRGFPRPGAEQNPCSGSGRAEQRGREAVSREIFEDEEARNGELLGDY